MTNTSATITPRRCTHCDCTIDTTDTEFYNGASQCPYCISDTRSASYHNNADYRRRNQRNRVALQDNYRERTTGRPDRVTGRWTETEDRILIQCYQDTTMVDLALLLHRSYRSVAHRVNRLDLRKYTPRAGVADGRFTTSWSSPDSLG